MTSVRLWQNLNVLFFQCALTAQMVQKFKSSEPDAGHVTRKIGPLYFSENRASGVPPVFSLENTPSEIMFAHCRPSLLPLRSNEG